MTSYYYCYGTTLANLVNFEDMLAEPIQQIDNNEIPLLPPNVVRVQSGAVVRNGAVQAPLIIDVISQADYRTLVRTLFDSWTIASKPLFIVALSEEGYFEPFRVVLSRPLVGENYDRTNSAFIQNLALPGYDWTRQETDKTSTGNISASERYINADSTSGNITLTLPDASTVNANTPFVIVKTVAANTVTVDGSGAQTIDGSASVDLDDQYQRLDIVSDGVNKWTSITYNHG